MDLNDFAPHPDLIITGGFGLAAVAALLALMVIYGDGMIFDTTEGRPARILNRIGAGAGAVLVIGVVGFFVSWIIAMGAAGKAANQSFHSSLQSTYGATTDADRNTAQRGVSIPVRTVRGNELVTFREIGGKLVAFRADGTELPRG